MCPLEKLHRSQYSKYGGNRRISSAFSRSCSEHLLWVSHCRFRVGILGLPFGVRWRCLPTLGALGCLPSHTFGGSKMQKYFLVLAEVLQDKTLGVWTLYCARIMKSVM